MSAPGGGAISTRQGQLRNLLQRNAPHLLELHPDIIESTDPVVRNALLWLYEVETCVSLVRSSSRGLLITYEQLADDAYVHARAMFDHLGITYGEQTRRYIDALYGTATERDLGPRRTGWGHRYFSVFRNPREQKDSWKMKISSDDREKIQRIVAGSEAVRYCADIGGWS
jgi:hypothetical protein